MPVLDQTILFLYLGSVLAIGWMCRRNGNASSEHRFLAGRKMGWWPIGISIMVTSFSAMNMIAIPEEISGHGLYVIFSFPVFFLAAWPISKIWMPYFHRLNCTTVYEFLENRYSRQVRLLASGLFLIWRLLWMAIALYVSGKILGVFTEQSPVMMIAVCGFVATLYTFIGGMKAVMMTDVLQFFVLFGGILLAVFLTIFQNPSDFAGLLQETGHLRPFTPFDSHFFSPDPTIRITFWSALLGTFTAFMTRYGADQVVMQRYFTAKNLKQAQRGIWLNACISVLALSLLSILGLAIYVHAVQTGALVSGESAQRGFTIKQLAAICHSFPPGVSGLFIAGILAATMSSVDSGINACSTALVIDFKVRLTDRILSLVSGLSITLLAILLLPPLNRNQSLFAIISKLINGLGTPLLAIIVLAMFSKHTTARGVFIGGLIGILCSLLTTGFIHNLALHYYAVINFIVSIGACLLASKLDKSAQSITD